MKILGILLMALLCIGSACSSDEPIVIIDEEKEPEEITLQIVDKNATLETKALLSNLWDIQSSAGLMFGHHDDLIYGRDWQAVQDRSDTKEVCGDYPAVFSLDFAQIMGARTPSAELNADRKRTILEARARGEVITACVHLDNPLTGGDAWDNSNNTVVQQILIEGSDTNIKFKSWLDNLVAFLADLKDDNGTLIPIIFRPFHEHTQTWSWWGQSMTTAEEFIGLWKFTIHYLRDEKGVHNLIYAISPQLDAASNREKLLFRWPGDEYVDFIGMDSYHGRNTEALISNAKLLEELSMEKMKPCGITETGIEGVRNSDGSDYAAYWTKEILTPLIGKEISMVIMWRNKYDPLHEGHHFYGPWERHKSADDFRRFYNSSFTRFSADLPDMYHMAEGVSVE